VVIEASVNIAPVLRAVDRLKKTDGRKVFREVRKPMRADLRQHAKDKAGPDGSWKALAPSTKDRMRRAGRRRRKLLGRLPAAFKITHGSNFIRAEWLVKWSRVHWKGGRAGHGSRIPKRNFAFVSKKLIREVRDMFSAALKRTWEGKR
jgi:phage gpG-like protein